MDTKVDKEIENMLKALDPTGCINDTDTLEQVFEKLCHFNIEGYRKTKGFVQHVLIILKNTKKRNYKFLMFPIMFNEDSHKDAFADMIKGYIKWTKENPIPDLEIVGVFTAMDAYISQVPKENIDYKTGKLKEDVLRPSKDPNAKEVLVFSIEENFIERRKTYEYVKSDNGDIVIQDEPMFSTKNMYDGRLKGRFNNMFMQPNEMN